ncbi:histone-lysine N-methyltransferase 2D-like isoform X1 [Seriola lalandi dorsalis]|uniref:histone-lysine N-methyltransferase 2D-like isoform X1 n=1 Tax=Seriola lalandi dorsalis TaxID=1841481 RepID=UPI000C6FBC61|nr:histone-lysine N-methyltransferase 2D-like isoform X1 [Seriola lalandi dorsalis]
MRKGTLNFLGRKNQSLFDTNIKIRDMDNVELVLDAPAIPESGTASVRARPTVKHHAVSISSSDSFQGFAVPTPKVPLLPHVNGPKANGSVSGEKLYNGSVPDLVEGEIFVPPPPSMAPPPPPGTFIPPPDFLGDLNSPDLATLQPPSMPAPKAPPQTPAVENDLGFLKRPTMAPPQPPSTLSTGSAPSTPISSPPAAKVPEHPKFAPPLPPTEKQQKTYKTPPPKPIRLSSMSNLDSPPQTPAPPPPLHTPTLSTFNPQNTAKLYNVPETSPLSSHENRDTRPKQMLLLEDSGSVNSAPVLVQVDGKVPKVATPTKPVSKDVQELKENLQITQPSQPPLSEPNKEAKTGIGSAQPEITKLLPTTPQKSPQLLKVNSSQVNSEPSKGNLEGSPYQRPKFSPLLDRKLRSLKSSETNGAREGPAASPLALLMAAKERDKHRSTHSLSRENSAEKNEQPSASIHPSDSSPNSFVVVPRSKSSSSLTSQERIQESPSSLSPVKHTQTIQTPEKSRSPASSPDQMPFTSPALNRITAAASPSATNLVEQKQNAEQSPPKTQSAQPEDNKEEISMPLLPPPPEFDDFEEIMMPPPSVRPPDPPVKKAPAPPVTLPPAPPAPSTHPKPPAAPKLPPPDINIKPKPHVQTKPQSAPPQLPSPLSPSQATLLSILQKKMLEMDHKMAPVKEAEPGSDDWEAPLSSEDNKVPVVPKATPQSKNYPVVNKAATLDMRELEGKVAKKYETSSVKVPTSNGPSKHQYGMTFTIRPGTKQPITPVTRGEP